MAKDTLKLCGVNSMFFSMFLKYAWPVFSIMKERIKGDFPDFASCFDCYEKRY